MDQGVLAQSRIGREQSLWPFWITDRGTDINNKYLARFAEFQTFTKRIQELDAALTPRTPRTHNGTVESAETPDKFLRRARAAITAALGVDLLQCVRETSPAFFGRLIFELLISMGYAGSSEEAGRALGQSGDDGVYGVIDQDPRGVDCVRPCRSAMAVRGSLAANSDRNCSSSPIIQSRPTFAGSAARHFARASVALTG